MDGVNFTKVADIKTDISPDGYGNAKSRLCANDLADNGTLRPRPRLQPRQDPVMASRAPAAMRTFLSMRLLFNNRRDRRRPRLQFRFLRRDIFFHAEIRAVASVFLKFKKRTLATGRVSAYIPDILLDNECLRRTDRNSAICHAV